MSTDRAIGASRDDPLTARVLAWLLIQWLVLLISVLDVRISGGAPRPGQKLATDQMLVAQVAVVAMLFPILLPSARATIIIAATLWPFVAFSAALSSTPTWRVIGGCAYVGAWIILLGLWRYVLRPGKQQLTATALASALAIGGAILWYLHAEFIAGSPSVNWARDGFFGPIMGVLAVVHQEPPSPAPFLPLSIALTATCILAALMFRMRKQARHSTVKEGPGEG